MKGPIMAMVVACLLVMPIVASAQQQPIVIWQATETPPRTLAVTGLPGDSIEMKGKVCVPSISPVGGTFQLHFSIWGVGTAPCAIVCNNCFDYEACGGTLCPGTNVCISGAFGEASTNMVCGTYPGCVGTACGQDCSINKDTQYSPSVTLSPGQCSQEYTFTTPIDSSWTEGYYAANLDVLWNNRNLDIEYATVQIGGTPIVNVQIVGVVIVAIGSLATLGALLLRR